MLVSMTDTSGREVPVAAGLDAELAEIQFQEWKQTANVAVWDWSIRPVCGWVWLRFKP